MKKLVFLAVAVSIVSLSYSAFAAVSISKSRKEVSSAIYCGNITDEDEKRHCEEENDDD